MPFFVYDLLLFCMCFSDFFIRLFCSLSCESSSFASQTVYLFFLLSINVHHYLVYMNRKAILFFFINFIFKSKYNNVIRWWISWRRREKSLVYFKYLSFCVLFHLHSVHWKSKSNRFPCSNSALFFLRDRWLCHKNEQYEAIFELHFRRALQRATIIMTREQYDWAKMHHYFLIKMNKQKDNVFF